MIVILYFMFSVYSSNPLIGSTGEMYELLKKAAMKRPVAGNTDGSYLTMKSNFGLIFGVIQLCSGMGTVFLDQGYWQRYGLSFPDLCECYLMMIPELSLVVRRLLFVVILWVGSHGSPFHLGKSVMSSVTNYWLIEQ